MTSLVDLVPVDDLLEQAMVEMIHLTYRRYQVEESDKQVRAYHQSMEIDRIRKERKRQAERGISMNPWGISATEAMMQESKARMIAEHEAALRDMMSTLPGWLGERPRDEWEGDE